MEVSRSGYYKWLKTKDTLNNYELNRNEMCELVKEYHKKHPSWGYRHINRQIRVDIGWYVSDNFVHKCCKFLGIKSVVRNYKYRKPGEESIKYPNLVKGNWDVSNVVSLYEMFSSAGNDAKTLYINLSGWNIVSATDMTKMFEETGSNSTSWTVIISKTSNGNVNTTLKLYGKYTSNFAAPPSGRTFTLAT